MIKLLLRNSPQTTERYVSLSRHCQHLAYNKSKQCLNCSQVNGGGGVYNCEFTKSLIFRDFDDVSKDLFRYVHLFPLLALLSKKKSKFAMHDL